MRKINITAVVVPTVNGDRPFSPISIDISWKHVYVHDLQLADCNYQWDYG